MKQRSLILEDGTVFNGKAFGADCSSSGELTFSTGMTGYQEVILDPAAAGRIIAMTYPLIGNTGINRQTEVLQVGGLVVREYCDEPSHFESTMALGEMMAIHGIPGIEGIDTRKLMRIIREKGPLKGRLTEAKHQTNAYTGEENFSA